MNELSWGSPTNEALRRRFGVEGTAQGGPVLTMGSDIFPTFPVGISSLDADCQHLAGYRLGAQQLAVTPTAGQTGSILLANPASSGTLITIDEIRIRISTANDVIVSIGGAAPGAPVAAATGVPRDSRRNGQGTTGRLLSHSNPASTGTALFTLRGLSTEDTVLNQPFVLAPLSFLMLVAGAVTVTLQASFAWRERTAMAWEL